MVNDPVQNDKIVSLRYPSTEICPGCGKLVDDKGYIVVCRWHLVQRFHAKSTCLSKIEKFCNDILITKLGVEYRGYKKRIDGKDFIQDTEE
jgi:hypothetical protein